MADDVDVLSGAGVVSRLTEVVAGFRPRRVLVVGGQTGLAVVGVAHRLRGLRVRYFSEFTPNPRLTDVLAGAALAQRFRPDLVLGVGGGSALDVAKMVRLLPPRYDEALAMLSRARTPVDAGGDDSEAGEAEPDRVPPLVLVPTTAGTGSEVTRFATVYVDELKYSLDNPRARADVALVDPELTHSCPADLTFSCALDALAHAVESTWSTRSTPQSRALAGDALGALAGILGQAAWPLDAAARDTLSAAATRAGLAIDITRTTGGHAFAYPLTARFGVPHGLACALNLSWLLPLTVDRLGRDCQDPRGMVFVERRLADIAAGLGAAGPEDSGAMVSSFVTAAGFAPRLSAYGVGHADLPWLVDAGLGSGRSAGGPVRLDPVTVLDRLSWELQADALSPSA